MLTPNLRDRILGECQHLLNTFLASSQQASPADNHAEAALTNAEKKHITGLMRVNHSGEVCAQALYRGQALVAKDEATREYLLHSADEETKHLYWCQKRLQELSGRTSLLNPFWYQASFITGVLAALKSDALSLGFVEETEKQVTTHLEGHLAELPSQDHKTKAVLQAMQEDEQRHGAKAKARGAASLPTWLKRLMAAQAKVMTTTAYYL